ncbi:MAG TPA: hypothetical protein VJA25_06340 [Dehalococcoidia bacterium]|nr:hypothetical protein [Dehalococcoidia bacterium]
MSTTRDLHLTGFAQVQGLTKEQADIIFKYLADSFSGKPLPELPESWLAAWTYY